MFQKNKETKRKKSGAAGEERKERRKVGRQQVHK
jgi:hypothetical protein